MKKMSIRFAQPRFPALSILSIEPNPISWVGGDPPKLLTAPTAR